MLDLRRSCGIALLLTSTELVLWQEAYLPRFNVLVPDLAYSLRCREEHTDASDRAVPQWPFRQCIPERRGRNNRGYVHPSAALDSNDNFHWLLLRGPSTWTPARRLHQFIHLLVTPAALNPHPH